MASFDVIVIGGGPAGLMAAAAAGRGGARVLLLEKGPKLGRKLIISGGGRCNVTNRKPVAELVGHIPGNGRFMFSAFAAFGTEEIIGFFEGLGIPLKEEDQNRIFPVSDRAVTVAAALIHHLADLGVECRVNTAVQSLLYERGRCSGLILRNGERFEAGAVVVAVGGCSVPRTGSTGDGYAWARAAGHTITDLYPAEVPLTASDRWVAERVLQGLSLQGVLLTLWDSRGKRLTAQRGDMIFTHFGLSGPAALRVSHYVSVFRLKHGALDLYLTIDLHPEVRVEEALRLLTDLTGREPRKAVRNLLRGLLPERMAPLCMELAGVAPDLTGAHLSGSALRTLAGLVKGFPVTVTGTLPLEEAFVTGGGVSVREIDPRTMESRLMPALFFAGEIMDVHGHTGGYNITVAFSSGHAAGTAAALASRVGTA